MDASTPVGASGPTQATESAAGGRTVQRFLKDIGLFFAAPFITVAYLLLFPFIGLVMLIGYLRQSAERRRAS